MHLDERELFFTDERPLHAWRLFRVRSGADGAVLAAPLIHDPGFELFPARVIHAVCYDHAHPAPWPGCRCGLYAVVEGSLDSLSGYLLDSAHDTDVPVFAEVACTGRVFVDVRGVRVERLSVLRLAVPDGLMTQADGLRARYSAEVHSLEVLPAWLVANERAQGMPAELDGVDLDALVERLRTSE